MTSEVRIALLLSCTSFEEFFAGQLGLDRARYVHSYRNDFSWEYAKHLRSVGVALYIYVPTLGQEESFVTDDGFHVRFISLTRAVPSFYHYLPWMSRTPPGRWVSEAAHAVAMLPSLRRHMSTDGIQLLYVQEYWTGRFDALALLAGVPIMAGDHGGRAHRQVKLLKRLSFRRARALTSQSRQEAAEVGRFGGAARVLGNAVDTDFFRPDPCRGSEAALLHVGRLVDSHKRTSVVLEAVSLLPGRFRLDIVGDGPDRGALEDLAEELEITHRVRFHGFITDRSTLRRMYQNALALIQPSRHEARLLVVLEAMACGTPAVVSDIPVFHEMVDNGRDGVIVMAGRPGGLMRGVLEVEASGLHMRCAARERVVARHGWSATAPAFRQLIDGIGVH